MASSFECAPGEVAPSSRDAAGRDVSVSRSDFPADHRFRRSRRLTARRQFLTVYREGRRAGSAGFTLFGMDNGLGHSRLGLTVPRRVGGAVRRNRVKRVLREIYRTNQARLRAPLDIVVNARPSIVDLPAWRLERDLLKCFSQLTRKVSR